MKLTLTVRKVILSACGLLALTLGLLGAFLPLLPTTPFLLLAAVCFFHGSNRLSRWLESLPWVGKQLALWRDQRAISIEAKRAALIYLWTTISVSVIFFLSDIFFRILLLTLAIGVTLYLLQLRTLSDRVDNKPAKLQD